MLARMPCAFCRVRDGETSAAVVLDEPNVFAILDIRPVFKGHVLVMPRVHHETLTGLPPDLVEPVFAAARRVAAAVVAGLEADGSFVAVNNAVSQSVPHLHVHVVPRRRKDGLRGFFWPRTTYESDAEMADYAARLRAALAADPS